MKPTAQPRPHTGPRPRPRLRLLPGAAAVALALGAGLLSVPAATAATTDPAAPKVSAPRTSPTPGFHGEDRYSACDKDLSGDGPGWVGNGEVTLTVTGKAPAGTALTSSFQLWDTTYGGKRTHHSGSGTGAADHRAYIGSGLTHGKQYAWRARLSDSKLTSPYTPWCYFRVDRTQPTGRIRSKDFPASDSGITPTKYPGQEGTLTLTAADTGSGVACARWSTSSTSSVGWKCSDEATDLHVVRLTNGAAKIKFRPPTRGTTSLFVEVMDNAGNVSQPVTYSFYVPSNPHPNSVFGDVDQDSKPDVLIPDAAGNLRKPGVTDPRTPANSHHEAAPGGLGSWAGIQYTHRGSPTTALVDDLFAHAPGSSVLYRYRNGGDGLFPSESTMTVNKPTTCLNTAKKPIPCADHGAGDDWSGVTAIAAIGSVTGDSSPSGVLPPSSLLYVEKGRLWLARAVGISRFADATLLSTADWSGYDLLTPGRARGTDFPTLWARSKANGTIRAFALNSPSAFANPAAGPVLATLTTKAAPRVGSDGDLTGDGLPDLWSVSPTGAFTIHPGKGTAAPYPKVTGFTAPTP